LVVIFFGIGRERPEWLVISGWWLVSAVYVADGRISREEAAGGSGAGRVMRGKGRKWKLRGDRDDAAEPSRVTSDFP